MAAHLHTQIRGAVVTALTGLATSGARVYANRLMQLPDALQPTLIVTADEETAEPLTLHQPSAERRLALVVACYAKASAGLDDTLDQMSKEVEVALAAGITIGGRVLSCDYTGMSYDDELGDKPVGVKRLSFSVSFSAMSNAPDTLA
jgi:hypothetical protein